VPRISDEAVRSGAKGPKDLESSMMPEAWSSLVSGSVGAEQAANALKTPGGVEALLQKQASAPTNSAFDAALIGGAGQKSFNDTANTYGGGKTIGQLGSAEQASQDAWAKLTGDVKKGQEWQQKQSDIAKTKQELADQAAGIEKDRTADHFTPEQHANWADAYDTYKGQLGPIATREGFLGSIANINSGQDGGHFGSALETAGVTPTWYIQQASSQLDMSFADLQKAVGRMTDKEYQEFIVAGALPPWLREMVGPKAKGADRWNPYFGGIADQKNAHNMGQRALEKTGDLGKIFAEIAKFVL
jgi:hypothetical protein